jgi:hypothetical protein
MSGFTSPVRRTTLMRSLAALDVPGRGGRIDRVDDDRQHHDGALNDIVQPVAGRDLVLPNSPKAFASKWELPSWICGLARC